MVENLPASRKRRSPRSASLSELLLGLVVLVAINVGSRYAYSRLDLTKEGRYSLSPATKKLLRNLPDEVYVKVYLEGNFNAAFTRLHDATRDMLQEMRFASGGKIDFDFIEPAAGADEKTKAKVYNELYQKGIQPTDVTIKQEEGTQRRLIWPGALLSYGGKETAVQLLRSKPGASSLESLNASEEGLEYEFANAIRTLSTRTKPRVAFLDGNGEIPTKQSVELTDALKGAYTVERVNLQQSLQIDTGIRCLLFQQPTAAFSEPDKYKIDQFVMQGGKVLWMVDRLRANNDSMRSDNFVAVDNNLNLDDLLFKYGVRLNDNLALDLRSTRIPVVMGESGGQPQQQLISWPFYPLLLPTADHPVVRNLDNIEVKFAGNIDTVKAPGIRKTVLLATSPYTKLLYSPVRVSLGIVSERIDPKQYNKGRQPIAVLLEGTFPSLYRNRLAPQTQAVMDSLHMPAPRGESKPTAMIVVADGDLGANAIGRQSGRVFPMGFNPFERQTYANKEFLLNAIDYLADESGLIAVRNKDLKLRLLDKTKTHNQRTQWQLVTIGLPLALLGLLAMGLQTWRKRRFAR